MYYENPFSFLIIFKYGSRNIKKNSQHYIDGAKTGKGDLMKPAFHKDATIFGYIGDDLFSSFYSKTL